MIVYLHGFLSSPQSHKARLIRTWLEQAGRADSFLCPQIPPYPLQAAEYLLGLLRQYPTQSLCLVGSSLGGYYAIYLAEKLGCKAVLVNPAVRPYELLQDYLGDHTNPYSGETFHIEPRHIDDFKALEIEPISRPERYLLWVQTGDEVLDYRQAVEKMRGVKQTVIEGGDHQFVGFENFVGTLIGFEM